MAIGQGRDAGILLGSDEEVTFGQNGGVSRHRAFPISKGLDAKGILGEFDRTGEDFGAGATASGVHMDNRSEELIARRDPLVGFADRSSRLLGDRLMRTEAKEAGGVHKDLGADAGQVIPIMGQD